MFLAISVFFAKDFCIRVRYKKKQSRSQGMDPGRRKDVRSDSVKLSVSGTFGKRTAQSEKEWGVAFVCPDKNKLKRNAVAEDAALSQGIGRGQPEPGILLPLILCGCTR